MASMTTPTDERLREFRESVAPDLYIPETFVQWPQIEAELERLQTGIEAVQELPVSDRNPEGIARILRDQPLSLRVFQKLLTAGDEVGFADGRVLPTTTPASDEEIKRLADLLEDLGIWRVILPESSVTDLLRVAEIASDARRRAYRRGAAIQDRAHQVVVTSVEQAQRQGMQITLLPLGEFPKAAKGRVQFVIGAGPEKRPVAAIATVFQAQSGGRQQRDLSLTYPTLQADFDRIPLWLVLVADGRGLADTPSRVLMTLFESVAACMTLREAESGSLTDAIRLAAESGGLRPGAQEPLNRLIQSALDARQTVRSEDLPVPRDNARLALARFVAENSDLGIHLAPSGDSIAWSRADRTAEADRLLTHFSPASAISLLTRLLNATEATAISNAPENSESFVLTLSPDDLLPGNLLVVAASGAPTSSLLRAVSKIALHATPEAKLGVLIVPGTTEQTASTDHLALQRVLPASVVVLDVSVLSRLARGRIPPRDGFVRLVLEQTDLTKVSPYVLSSVTPQRMFYGREAEEATLLGTLPTNSVALLGGRRIGKTSLMRHVHSRLVEADFRPFFGDCQTVRTWEDFGDLTRRVWGATVPSEFKPRYLFDLVDQLGDESGRTIVLLLDEIDQLLDWDGQHTEDEVPEAFFRACRTLSQEGRAQFVFSGERVIATRLWDPQSPHWNFCRPLPLQQLTRSAAEQLLTRPLASMGVSVQDEPVFLDEAWRRTSGHPQIVQYLGDRLVSLLNDRPSEARGTVGVQDLLSIADSFEYRDHYLETYWGQATEIERLLSIWVGESISSIGSILEAAETQGINISEEKVVKGLRMIDLYGLVHQSARGYGLRAEWLIEALSAYGGPAQVADGLGGRVR